MVAYPTRITRRGQLVAVGPCKDFERAVAAGGLINLIGPHGTTCEARIERLGEPFAPANAPLGATPSTVYAYVTPRLEELP